MQVNIIVATDNTGLFSLHGEIPWESSEDLQYFKRKTMGRAIIMGRKTFDSIGRALPGRLNIVVSSRLRVGDLPVGVILAQSLQEAINLADIAGEAEAFIIGGKRLYEEGLAYADKVYLTLLNKSIPCDLGDDRLYFTPPVDWTIANADARPWGTFLEMTR
jgi:dihydrofolate reductase